MKAIELKVDLEGRVGGQAAVWNVAKGLKSFHRGGVGQDVVDASTWAVGAGEASGLKRQGVGTIKSLGHIMPVGAGDRISKGVRDFTGDGRSPTSRTGTCPSSVANPKALRRNSSFMVALACPPSPTNRYRLVTYAAWRIQNQGRFWRDTSDPAPTVSRCTSLRGGINLAGILSFTSSATPPGGASQAEAFRSPLRRGGGLPHNACQPRARRVDVKPC